jgi:hypothetical protein
VDVLGRHLSWPRVLAGVGVALGVVLLVGFLGFGVAPWLILAGAFCAAMMGSMIWMMVSMGRNAMHHH